MCVIILDSNIVVMQSFCKIQLQSASFSYFFSISVSNASEGESQRLNILGPTIKHPWKL